MVSVQYSYIALYAPLHRSIEFVIALQVQGGPKK